MKSQDRERKLAEVHEQLMDAYKYIIDGDGWEHYLSMLAQFPSYSARNCALLLSQLPTAQRVAGMRTWNRLGRRVRNGERGLRMGLLHRRVTSEMACPVGRAGRMLLCRSPFPRSSVRTSCG